jgi:hypothetical protein
MTRIQVFLAVLAALLVVVLFYFLAWQPQQEELERIEADIQAQLDLQTQLTAERNRLRAVREEAPELEAELASAAAIVPSDPAIPALLRQLQQVADDSGLVLRVVSPSRAVQIEDADPGLSRLALSVQVEGTYFQIVDFLRRSEDPTLFARGVQWATATVTRDDEDYPVLTATVGGFTFADLPAPPPEELPGEAPDGDGSETAEDADGEAETEAEVNEPSDLEDAA